MRRGRMQVYSSRNAVLMILFIFDVAGCFAQAQHQSASLQDGRVREFLETYVGTPDAETKTTKYSAAFVDLRDDGKNEVLVYLSSNGWCGTGGCTMLILAPEGSSYTLVTRTTITRLPIRVLVTKSNGWHDISVVVAGGGIQPGYEADLSFDGKTYPSNPSVPPARRLKGTVQGKIVMPVTAKDIPLYQ
jgi:hypothetical protein